MLFERQTAYRADWEAVVTPVVDHLCSRSSSHNGAGEDDHPLVSRQSKAARGNWSG